MAIGLIDIGGTTIKFGCWIKGQLITDQAVATPANLAAFYQILTAKITAMKQQYGITGVSISSPGAVNQQTGIIGSFSAVPYIHNFDILSEFKQRFQLPVAIENDANCAALAEAADGAAKGLANVVLLAVGTGVGGAIILNGKIHHGSHLLGGEFGFMLHENNRTVSTMGTLVNAAKRYNQRVKPEQPLTGKQLYAAAQTGNSAAKKELQVFFTTLAKAIFNIQYCIDPDCFVISGGVSANPALLPDLQTAIKQVTKSVKIAPLTPKICIAHYQAEANLRGAAVNYSQQFHAN